MSALYHVRPPAAALVGWPPDDTEESAVGTDLHQTSITNLRWGLNELAATLALPDQPLPWRAYSQMTITGLHRWDGTAYTVLPDVFVYHQRFDVQQPSVAVAEAGPPLLIIEVLSPTTYESNLDQERGKGWTYADGGVAEYLTLDPAGKYVPEQGRGWRLVEGQYVPRLPEANGRWQSQVIAAAIGVVGLQVAVYSLDGRRQLCEGEVNLTLSQRDVMLGQQEATLRRQEQQLREKDDALSRERAERARQAEELAVLRRRLEELDRST